MPPLNTLSLDDGRTSPCAVRPLQLADLPAVMEIQRLCYGEAYVEGHELFARRLASPANCSLVALRGGEVVAYLAAYWSARGKVTPLHGDFDDCDQPDTLYLHDMAVHPAQAGQGLARCLLAPLWEQALRRGMRYSALVSVQGSQDYWCRHGYSVYSLQDPLQQQCLESYGSEAVYMLRAFSGDDAVSAGGESGDNVGYA